MMTMQWLIITCATFILGLALYAKYGDYGRWSTGRTYFIPPRHFNCRCQTIPSAAMKAAKTAALYGMSASNLSKLINDPKYFITALHGRSHGKTFFNKVYDDTFVKHRLNWDDLPRWIRKSSWRDFVKEPKQHKAVKNYLVQAQNAQDLWMKDWKLLEEKIMAKKEVHCEGAVTGRMSSNLILRKEQNMDAEERARRDGLRLTFIRTPYESEVNYVENLLWKAGYNWHPDIEFSWGRHGRKTCIAITSAGNMSYGSFDYYWGTKTRFNWKEPYKEITADGLRNLLNRKGKESKMSKTKTKNSLKDRFIQKINSHMSKAIQEMLFEAGFTWTGDDGEAKYFDGRYDCILIGTTSGDMKLLYSGSLDYSKEKYTEISLDELVEALTKSEPKLMTTEEMEERFDEDEGEEGALLLSIEKWERLVDPENWDELMENWDMATGGETCALCQWINLKNEGLEECDHCPIGKSFFGRCGMKDHPWYLSRAALEDGDSATFYFHAKTLLRIMKDALEELRKPKVYSQGQCFRNGRNHFILTVASRSPYKMILAEMETGNRWAGEVQVVDHCAITKAEFNFLSDGQPEDFVEVDITISSKEKK